MAFTQLSAMAKIALGTGLVSGGLLIAGIVWQGGTAIENIKQDVTEITQDFTEAVADNEFLKNQFNNLNGLYSSSVDEANATIDAIEQERNNLYSQIEMLQRDIPNDSDVQADTQKIQAEISRLESELNKANEQIFALEAEVQTANESVTYEPIKQSSYTAEAKSVDSASIPVSNSAMELNPTLAQTLSDNELWLEEQFVAKAPINITGVSTYTKLDGTTVVSLVIEQLLQPSSGQLSAEYTKWFTSNFGEGATYIVMHTEGASGTDNVMTMNTYGISYRSGGF